MSDRDAVGLACVRCGVVPVRIEASVMLRSFLVCACLTAFSAANLGSRRSGVAYCVALDCGCRPAGRSAGYGALTGRARWWLAATAEQAPGSEVTLCGGCYRRVRHVVGRAG